jgi:RarD protein
MPAKLKIILAMTVFGTLAIFVKNIQLTTTEIALFRALIAATVLVGYKLLLGKRIIFAEIKKDLILLFISGAAIGFNWILLFEAYNHTTVSIATLSYYFAPAIVIAVCPLLFRERLTVKQIVCFIMASVGLIMIIGVGGAEQAGNNLLGIAFGLGAAVLYATVIILNKYIKKVTGIDRTLIQFFAGIIILVPYTLATTGINFGGMDSIGIISLLTLGIVHTGISYVLYFSALKDLKGQEVAILSYIDPLVAVIISVAVLNEAITLQQIIGGMLILGFTLLNEIKLKPERIIGVQKRGG